MQKSGAECKIASFCCQFDVSKVLSCILWFFRDTYIYSAKCSQKYLAPSAATLPNQQVRPILMKQSWILHQDGNQCGPFSRLWNLQLVVDKVFEALQELGGFPER